jgi:hypothetical protein
MVRLMKSVIPEEQRPLLEIQEADYRPAWRRRVEHWLRCEDEVWWVLADDGEPGENALRGGVRAVHKRGRFPNRMEVLVRPDRGPAAEAKLVRQGVTSLRGSPRKPIETSVPAATGSLTAALRAEGFQEMRVLIQMKRDLRRKLSVHVKP